MRLPGGLRRSIRGKLLAVVLATTSVALLVNAAALFYYNVGDYRDARLADVRTQAEILARASAAALAFNSKEEAERDLAVLHARPDIIGAALYTAEGALFASFARAGEPVPERAGPPGHAVAGDRLNIFHPVRERGDALGTVYLSARYGLRDRMLDYLGIMALVIGAALASALALSAWLQRAVTGPILEVAAAARAVVDQRDYSARAARTTEDEVGVLADAFNGMLDEVRARSQALEASNASLLREMRERIDAEDALRAADRRKDEFLATLAHELRNPLAPIRNALYLLQAAGDDPAAGAEARAVIERQLTQMVRLVDDLLDVSRISTGKLALRRERVSLLAVAQNALEAAGPAIHARGHALHTELPPPEVQVNVDPTRLAQVLLNLLNNAAKFTQRAGRIDLHVGLEGTELVARVRDNGIGIPPGELERIFDMFAQGDRSLERSASGLGVGLSLSRHLVALHGGTLQVQSDGEGRGAEFVVRIPGVAAQTATGREPASARAAAGAAKRRILIADDNQDFAQSLALVLRRQGHEVRVEHDGAAALAAAEAFRPEFAFLDIGLPLLNGRDLARRLRSLPATSASILVAVTGWGQPRDRELAREAGFDAYLVKPVEIEQVTSLLG